MARTPSFRYMGGKSRLRKWLISKFPKSGRRYIEPFAGLGNVFYQARKDLSFKSWHLGEIHDFFTALLNADLDKLPDSVSREEFDFWRKDDSYIATLIEPKITFGGKGYKSGFDGGHPSHPPYKGSLHRETCEQARELLKDVEVKKCNWTDWDYNSLGSEDFVYFDPPYFGTKAPYPNINHTDLIHLLVSAKFKWAVSGYDNNNMYNYFLTCNKHSKQRNSEIKSSNTGKYEGVVETLWTNY